MRHFFSYFITMGFLLFSLSSSALIIGPIEIKGFVQSFDKKSVLIKNGAYTHKVPRVFVSKDKLKQGKFIEILLSQKQSLKVRTTKE